MNWSGSGKFVVGGSQCLMQTLVDDWFVLWYEQIAVFV